MKTGKDLSCMTFSPDNSKLAVGSHDARMYMIFLNEGNRVVRFGKSSSAVLHIDWSTDGESLRTSDSSYEYLFYNAASAKLDQLTGGATSLADT